MYNIVVYLIYIKIVIYVGAVHTVQSKQGKTDMNDTKGQKTLTQRREFQSEN
jgi:hypothetical protein